MKNALKKAISILLVAIMVFGVVPLAGFVGIELPEFNLFSTKAEAATYSGTIGDALVTFDYETGELVISGTGDAYGMITWDMYDVSVDYQFEIKSLKIGSGVDNIDIELFYLWYFLEKITVEDGNKNFSSDSDGVLYNKDKTKLLLYPIGCQRKNYIIPDSVITVEDYAFWGAHHLEKLTISANVEHFSVWSVEYCENLKNITVDENNKNFSSDNHGVLFNKDKTTLVRYPIGKEGENYTIPEGVTEIGTNAFESCKNLNDIIFPDSVSTIGDYAFGNCEFLWSLNLTGSIKTIGKSAFWGCRIQGELIIPSGVEEIGDCAFDFCYSITSVTIPDSVKSIGTGAFRSCYKLEKITVDENNQYYSNDSSGTLFNKNKTELIQYPINNERTSYTISESTEIIGDYAFGDCKNLTNITIPDSVTSIGDCAFQDCENFTNIAISDGVIYIGELCFYGCKNAETITIGKNVTEIGSGAFAMCGKLKSIEIPDGVIRIENLTFNGCLSLETISIPGGLTSIGQLVFMGCELKDVYYDGTQAEWEKIVIDKGSEFILDADIHFAYYYVTWVVDDSKATYKTKVGDKIQLYLPAHKEGYKYTGWDNPVPETMPACDLEFTATYEKLYVCPDCGKEIIGEDAINEHIVSETKVTISDGVIVTSGKLKPYTTITVYAPQVDGKIFSHWSVEGATVENAESNETTIALSSGKISITAEYEGCKCKCHQGGIAGFFFKIVLFFQKLFGNNLECFCGAKH